VQWHVDARCDCPGRNEKDDLSDTSTDQEEHDEEQQKDEWPARFLHKPDRPDDNGQADEHSQHASDQKVGHQRKRPLAAFAPTAPPAACRNRHNEHAVGGRIPLQGFRKTVGHPAEAEDNADSCDIQPGCSIHRSAPSHI
jgi:hypothetical protein